MITEIEKQEIVDKAAEKVLLRLPEVMGNLMANHAAMAKLNSQFYKDNPEFTSYKDSVVSVIEMIEGKDPTADYKDILKKSVPEIKKRISLLSKLNTDNVAAKPNRDFNGEI